MNATSPIKILPGGRKTRRSPRRRCKHGYLKSPRYSNGRRLVCRKTPRRRSSPRRRLAMARSRARSRVRSRARSAAARRRSSPRRRCKHGYLKSPRYSNGRRLVCRKSPRRRSSPRRRRSSPRRRRSSPRRRRSSPRRKSRVTRKSQNRCSRHRGARSCGSDPACFWDGKKCSLPRARAKQTFYGPMGYASRGLF